MCIRMRYLRNVFSGPYGVNEVKSGRQVRGVDLLSHAGRPVEMQVVSRKVRVIGMMGLVNRQYFDGLGLRGRLPRIFVGTNPS